jgi:hypothetical protein
MAGVEDTGDNVLANPIALICYFVRCVWLKSMRACVRACVRSHCVSLASGQFCAFIWLFQKVNNVVVASSASRTLDSVGEKRVLDMIVLGDPLTSSAQKIYIVV